MSATFDSLLEYYVNLLIVQYKILPKARATIKCLVNNALCDDLPRQLQTAFNLNTAVGKQLDVIGRIVGVPRNVYGLDLTHVFFNFTRYSGIPASNGFNRYSTPTDSELLSTWRTTATYIMTDFEMRSLIKLKIILNNAYESLYFIKNALYAAFPPNTSVSDETWDSPTIAWDDASFQWVAVPVMLIDIVDNLDTTITYNVYQPYYNTMIVANYLGVLPKPMGVAVSVNYL